MMSASIGSEQAKIVGDFHEVTGSENPDTTFEDTEMDLFNNECRRKLGTNKGSNKNFSKKCISAINSAVLKWLQ